MTRATVSRSVLALSAALAVSFWHVLAAQTPAQGTAPPQGTMPAQVLQPGQRTVFRAGVDVVSVDAIVTDSKGNLVTDLTADDFEIKENNKPQSVSAFKLIQIDDTVDIDPGRYPEIHSMEDQEREAARDDVRLFVIFLDDYHVRRGNDVSVREQLARFVRTLSPRDMVAVMYPLTPALDLTFSRDHEATAELIRKFRGRKYDYSPQNSYEDIYLRLTPQQIELLRIQVTRTALSSICTYLGTLRDGRKSVLFVSEGFSGNLPNAIGRDAMGLPPLPPNPNQNQAASALDDRAAFQNNLDVLQEMKPLFEDAARSNTAIYTIDPRGLTSNEFDLSQPHVDAETDRRVLSETQDSLRIIADQTGGMAIVNFNDVSGPLKQMIHETSAYYLLGYTTTETKHDGKFHEIKVSVKRKGLTVRARKGYWAYSEDDMAKAATPAAPAAPREVTDALNALAPPPRSRAVRTWVGIDRGADGKAAVTLVWEAIGQPGGHDDVADRVDVIAGSSSGESAFRGRVEKDPHAAQPSGRVTFAAKPGVLHLRLAAQTADGAQLDADSLDVTVPDFTAVGPLISTPAVYQVRTARDVQQIANGNTPMPEAGREFSRAERLVLRFNAYGPAESAPVLTARLLNQHGDAVSALAAPTRGADGFYQLDLPLAGLAAGDFVVEVEATSRDGAKTHVFVAFVVTA
jgi:VWFA-related protein